MQPNTGGPTQMTINVELISTTVNLMKVARQNYDPVGSTDRQNILNGLISFLNTTGNYNTTFGNIEAISTALLKMKPGSQLTDIQKYAILTFHDSLISHDYGKAICRSYYKDDTRLLPNHIPDASTGWSGAYLPSLIYLLIITHTRRLTYMSDREYNTKQINAAIIATIMSKIYYCVDDNITIHNGMYDQKQYEYDPVYLKFMLDVYSHVNNTVGTDVLQSIVFTMYGGTDMIQLGLKIPADLLVDQDILHALVFSAVCLSYYQGLSWNNISEYYEDSKQLTNVRKRTLSYLTNYDHSKNLILPMVKFILRMKYPRSIDNRQIVDNDYKIKYNILDTFISTQSSYDLINICRNILSLDIQTGGASSSEWLSTKRRVTVKGSRKTVYRSRKTGELRVRSVSINGRGTRTVRYVKFKSNLFSRS
jgi:hypothetical protein